MSHKFEPLEETSGVIDWASHSVLFPAFLWIFWEPLRKEELTLSYIFLYLGKTFWPPLFCSAFSPHSSALLVLYLPCVSSLSFSTVLNTQLLKWLYFRSVYIDMVSIQLC